MSISAMVPLSRGPFSSSVIAYGAMRRNSNTSIFTSGLNQFVFGRVATKNHTPASVSNSFVKLLPDGIDHLSEAPVGEAVSGSIFALLLTTLTDIRVVSVATKSALTFTLSGHH